MDDRARERALVVAAKEGDRDAFETLYRAYVAGIARHVRWHLGHLGEDAVAEVFLRAWRGLGSYRDLGLPFGAWLFGIAKHVVADELRDRGRVVPFADPPDVAVEPRTAELVELHDAIERLGPEHRRVIEMKYLMGLTNDEVAAATGTTASAVNSMRWRALQTLRAHLEER